MPQPAPTPQTGADILVQCLVNHGVEVVFAYPGGASMPIHQALTRFSDQLRTILPRHEQGGGFAAEGYARTTGKVGVCMATSGPGATNFVTCLADAKMDSVPDRRHHRPGRHARSSAPTPSRRRRSSRSAGRSPSTTTWCTRTEDIAAGRQGGVPHRHAPAGRGRSSSTCPRTCRTRTIVPDCDPPMNLPGYRPDRRATRERARAGARR